MTYELFLDEDGKKISKSKGKKVVTVDKWIKYGGVDSLKYFMFQSPERAKKLTYDIIPKTLDEYLKHLESFHEIQDEDQILASPIYYIHEGKPPKIDLGKITFSLLLNLVNACNTENEDVIWHYITSANENLNEESTQFVKDLMRYAMNYYHDFVKPKKNYKIPNAQEKEILDEISVLLLITGNDAEKIQKGLFDIAKSKELDIKEYFKSLYQILFGTPEGPRLGAFINLYGIRDTMLLIAEKKH